MLWHNFKCMTGIFLFVLSRIKKLDDNDLWGQMNLFFFFFSNSKLTSKAWVTCLGENLFLLTQTQDWKSEAFDASRNWSWLLCWHSALSPGLYQVTLGVLMAAQQLQTMHPHSGYNSLRPTNLKDMNKLRSHFNL